MRERLSTTEDISAAEEMQGLETTGDLDDSDVHFYTSSPQSKKGRKSTRATIGGGMPNNFHLVGATPYSQLPWCIVTVLTKEESRRIESFTVPTAKAMLLLAQTGLYVVS